MGTKKRRTDLLQVVLILVCQGSVSDRCGIRSEEPRPTDGNHHGNDHGRKFYIYIYILYIHPNRRKSRSPVKMSWTPCHYLFGHHYFSRQDGPVVPNLRRYVDPWGLTTDYLHMIICEPFSIGTTVQSDVCITACMIHEVAPLEL